MLNRKMRRALAALGLLSALVPAAASAQVASQPASLTLNHANYTVVKDTDFTKMNSEADLTAAGFGVINGPPSAFWFSGANGVAMYAGGSTSLIGFEEANGSPTMGHPYGLYEITSKSAQSGQGVGVFDLLWPANNQWTPDPGANTGEIREFDLYESWDGTNTAEATFHYKDPTAPSYQNGSQIHSINGLTLTNFNTFQVDWEPQYTDYYVNNKWYFRDTTHPTRDAADGGTNMTFGAGLENETGPVGLYVLRTTYSAPNGGTAPPPAVTDALTLNAPQGAVTGSTTVLNVSANYSNFGSAVTVNLDAGTGNAQSLNLTTAGQSGGFNVTLPATLAAGSHTAQVVDGSNATSNTVTFTEAAPSGIVTSYTPAVVSPAANALYGGLITFSGTGADPSGSLLVQWQNYGAPTSGVPAKIKTDGTWTAAVTVDHVGTAGTLWIKSDSAPFAQVYTATPASAPAAVTTGTLSATAPTGIQTNQKFSLSVNYAYSTGTPTHYALQVDGGAVSAPVATTVSGGSFPVAVPAFTTGGNHTLVVSDPDNISVASAAVSVSVSAPATVTSRTLSLTAPGSVVGGQGWAMSLASAYSDGTSPQHINYIINGRSIGPISLGSGASPYTLSMGGFSAGQILSVVVQDADKPSVQSAPVSVKVVSSSSYNSTQMQSDITAAVSKFRAANPGL